MYFRIFVLSLLTVLIGNGTSTAQTLTFPPTVPSTAVRVGPEVAACRVSYPDSDKGSKSIKWDADKQTLCGFEVTEVSRSQGAAWWWSAHQNGLLSIFYECNSGPFFDQWGSWTEVHFSALVVPGILNPTQLKDQGCLVPEAPSACVCTKDNPKKVEDCYKGGGNCLGQISTIDTRCVVGAAACTEGKFAQDCKVAGGTLLLIPNSPFCRKSIP